MRSRVKTIYIYDYRTIRSRGHWLKPYIWLSSTNDHFLIICARAATSGDCSSSSRSRRWSCLHRTQRKQSCKMAQNLHCLWYLLSPYWILLLNFELRSHGTHIPYHSLCFHPLTIESQLVIHSILNHLRRPVFHLIYKCCLCGFTFQRLL